MGKDKISKRFLQTSVWPRIGARVSLNDISVIDVRDTIIAKSTGKDNESDDEEARRSMMDDIPEGKVTRGNFDK